MFLLGRQFAPLSPIRCESNYGINKKCEFCGNRGTKIEWANKDHKYSRNQEDYIALCTSCHRKYDIKNNNWKMGISYNYIYQNQKTGTRIHRNEPLPEDTEGYKYWKLIFHKKDGQMKNYTKK